MAARRRFQRLDRQRQGVVDEARGWLPQGQGFATHITLADGAVSSGPTALAKVTDTIASVNIRGGRADAVKAVATATRAGSGPIQLSEAGSDFVNLVIAGEALSSLKVKPNTKVELLNGAVTVNLHKVTSDARTIEVTMIELVSTGAGTGLRSAPRSRSVGPTQASPRQRADTLAHPVPC